ncbi:non-homologous end joining protein Ku [Tunturiibacter lichenicola]|uniref:non-homologous end joining protein Ku n=1 Tax=Tunturiibacter lichenicola TaxID=2051959 RepID=UPI0021B2E82A|nr:Ku protein [Edaphobacter lichenicola]
MPRPYWSGQIQISLVSFGVKLFPATESKSEIHFHQLSRKSGERIKHQKVSGDEEPIENADIVKGYEYRKGEYVMVEPDEIEHLRIPSRHTLAVTQLVDEDELDPEFFEKPYFVVPEDDMQGEAFAVVRKALQATKKVALGKIAFGGREHLVAISAPSDDKLAGMMAYTMRYAEELRNPAEYFGEIKKVAVDEDQLSLAKELIKRKAAKFAPEKFKDEYEAALRELVKAKIAHKPIPRDEAAPKSAKVINLMDALRKSVRGDEAPATKKKAATKSAATAKKGITLVKPARTKASKQKKSA